MLRRTISEIALTLLLISIANPLIDTITVKAGPTLITVPDDYPTIQEAINHSEGGDTIFVRRGTYFEHVTINKSISLIGENTKETIIDGKGESGTTVDLVADDIIFSDFTVQNGGYFLDYSCGIHLKGSNSNVSNSLITNNAGTGIWMEDANNNTLLNNTISNNGQKGIWMLHSIDNFLRNNSFVSNSYNLAAGDVNDIDQSNTVNGKPIYYLVRKNDLVIDSQTFPNIGYLALVDSANVTVRDLRLSRNGEGLLFFNTDSSRIQNCTFTDNYKAVVLTFSDNNTILGNNATDVLEFWNSNRNVISENVISHINDYGLILVGGSHNKISNNTIKENKNGIMISNSQGNTIIENKITDNLFSGLNLWYAYHTVVANNVIANSSTGIFHRRAGPQIILGNYIADCEHFGYQAEEPWYDSMVFHNNFVNATVEIYSKFNMTMDNGYPAGGNFWSDYHGLDLYRGIYQNEMGSDGIGDVPYLISQNHTDRYPLMNRWDSSVPFACFTCIPHRPWANESVLLEVSCSYQSWDVVGYEWNFDDGNITTVTQPTIYHNYERPGRYNAAVKVVVNETFGIPVNQTIAVCYRTDLNGDAKVDIGDITIVAVAFWTRAGDPEYNEFADLDKNGVVNIIDISMVAKDYGKAV